MTIRPNRQSLNRCATQILHHDQECFALLIMVQVLVSLCEAETCLMGKVQDKAIYFLEST